ncbi:MAG: UDP-glucose--hexose-1-phosphate uridylyltransferase [Clostridia bacterium]|nr:UDP-glucose--hexose-1-phosphate uridylyltransferase [Clostridia bacterium]
MSEPKINLSLEIGRLVQYALQTGLIEAADKLYAQNRLVALLGADALEDCEIPAESLDSPAPILERLLDYAHQHGVLESNAPYNRDIFDTELMAALTPRPSEVQRIFNEKYAADPKEATDWFYHFSQATNYIRTDRIARDMRWLYPSAYGDIVITINLSKPEKDPMQVALLKKQKSSGYPRCALCVENEGYRGTAQNAARGNHRILPVTLDGENWFMQYSPYVYYNEHCIAFNREHVPMMISGKTFRRLLDFIDCFPHYFLGSNADLPIVGGSITTHDHFQGGSFTFPMEVAPDIFRFTVKGFEDITCSAIKWPLSVIRISSTDRKRLAELAEHILARWRAYSDESVGILAETDGEPHNTITPIARRRGEAYELDLALRNNRTSDEHPLGIFHPHAEYHHIKRENIGLIEVMGLAVLPGRLKNELGFIRDCLLGDREAFFENPSMEAHCAWYRTLCERDDITEENVDDILRAEVGLIFCKVLENAGVFKGDEAGIAAFRRFAESLS